MALHIETGKYGESIAVKYLILKEFQIIECNWRHKRLEVDIIAVKNKIIHFIEVKTRHSTAFGFPEESVDRKKFKNMQKAAVAYLSRFTKEVRIQFDIVAITRIAGKKAEILFIEDVYIY